MYLIRDEYINNSVAKIIVAFSKGNTEGQQMYEKMLNITSLWGNAKLNSDEL